MTGDDLQALCERGQEQLMRMEYLDAEATLARAEQIAWAARDWDTLSRLYMPLQEARRQKRQRCGEGVICLDLIAEGPGDHMDARHVLDNFSHGQLLVAGWGSIEPSMRVRELAAQHGLYLETFLAAAYPAGDGQIVAIIPLPEAHLPEAAPRAIDELIRLLPAHSLVLPAGELPQGSRRGTHETYAQVMSMWERLHLPFLAAADHSTEPVLRMEGYRKTIRVDAACELAHQKLSDVARELTRGTREESLPQMDTDEHR